MNIPTINSLPTLLSFLCFGLFFFGVYQTNELINDEIEKNKIITEYYILKAKYPNVIHYKNYTEEHYDFARNIGPYIHKNISIIELRVKLICVSFILSISLLIILVYLFIKNQVLADEKLKLEIKEKELINKKISLEIRKLKL